MWAMVVVKRRWWIKHTNTIKKRQIHQELYSIVFAPICNQVVCSIGIHTNSDIDDSQRREFSTIHNSRSYSDTKCPST